MGEGGESGGWGGGGWGGGGGGWGGGVVFFFNDTATTEIYTLSLHDALPIYGICVCMLAGARSCCPAHALVAEPQAHVCERQGHSHATRFLKQSQEIGRAHV